MLNKAQGDSLRDAVEADSVSIREKKLQVTGVIVKKFDTFAIISLSFV